MDIQSNVCELHEHRDEIEGLPSRDPRGAPRPTTRAVTPTTCGSGWYHDAAIDEARVRAVEARCHPVHW